MKAVYMLGLAALVIGAGLLAGCVEEVLDPDLDFEVMDVYTNLSSPNPSSENETGFHHVYVKVDMENKNKEIDITIAGASFYADDNVTEVTGQYLANETTVRRIDSIRIDAKTNKAFWVVFKVPDGTTLTYIRYRGTLDEPVEKNMPAYPAYV